MKMIEIATVGGYDEVGRNMTAVKVDDEVVIFDIGIHLENYTNYTQDEDILNIDAETLIAVNAVPNISKIDDWKDNVKAIIPSHAHLDHVGGIPFLANAYKAPVLCTPFTGEVLRAILRDEKIRIKNSIKIINLNSSYKISKNLTVEFVNMTHSTPQTVLIVLHTKYGAILYANDFKFDQYPTLGKKPDFRKLEELGNKGVLALIVDSTYSNLPKKMPSESVAKEMLKDVLLGTDSKNKAVVITTFSSHLARLKSIIEFGKKLNRRIVFLGRSLSKYVGAGENVNIVRFSQEIEMVKYKSQIKKRLSQIMREGKQKYLLVVTGHQGEPKSTLARIINNEFDFKFNSGDHVIFSCNIIPTSTNRANREALEKKLEQYGVRIFRGIHVSGHAAREDSRDLINFVKPKHIIPSHGDLRLTSGMVNLASEMGYQLHTNIHQMKNGQRISLE